MANVDQIISEAESLPVEQRARVVERLLRSLNAPNPDVDAQWAAVARQRLEDVRSGKVKTIPGEEVFDRIRNRFES